MQAKADPGALNSLPTHHVQVSIYFIKDYVLDSWDARVDDCDAQLEGTACDDKLLELAAHHRAPLITNEGYSLKLRFKALARGLTVSTPRQFWEGRMGERATKKFLARFDTMAPKYVQGQGYTEAATNAVSRRRGILRHIFFGETKNSGRVPVRLPEGVASLRCRATELRAS